MPLPRAILPYLPHEGPPVPRVLPGWPATFEDVERAVRNYRVSAFKAVYDYQLGWERRVEHYRDALLRRLP